MLCFAEFAYNNLKYILTNLILFKTNYGYYPRQEEVPDEFYLGSKLTLVEDFAKYILLKQKNLQEVLITTQKY